MTHYYDREQDSPFEPVRIPARLRGQDFLFYTSKGVFSRKKIDKGTHILIENGIMEYGWRILDLGCGYGPLGVTFARLFPTAEVVMTDVNERAVKLARMNLKNYHIKNATVHQGEGFEKVEGQFDAIFLNPPQSAGRKTCLSLISQARTFLKEKGYLQIVMRHTKGGKYTEGEMRGIYDDVKAIAKQSGYRVYLGVKAPEAPDSP